MEKPVAFMVDKIKGIAKSSQDFFDGFLRFRENSRRRNPIEILKRLQQEAFSDLMTLRDRLDKVERMISLYKIVGSPFQDAGTNVKGDIDVLGAIIMMGDTDRQHYDALGRAGIKAGISSRLAFETTVREKDTLVAEFLTSQKGTDDDVSGGSLSLAKLLYMANINDWFSAFAIPVGAEFRDLEKRTNYFSERKGITDFSFVGPPLLNERNDMAIGLAARKSNVVALMVQSVSGLGRQLYSDRIEPCFNMFGQIVYQCPRGIKLSLLGLHQFPKPSGNRISLGAITIPVGFLRCHRPRQAFPEEYDRLSEIVVEVSSPLRVINIYEMIPTGSIALKLDSEFAECAKIGAWIEMKNSNPKQLQWAINAYDESEDELGWGLSFSGTFEHPNRWSRFQAESYLKLKLSKKFSLKPGIAYVEDNNASIFALMLRSNWSF